MFGLSHAMFRHTEDASLRVRPLGHPSKGLQVLVEAVSAFFGRKKLLFTQLNQSLLQHLHTHTLEPRNLGETHHMHVNTSKHMDVNKQDAAQDTRDECAMWKQRMQF